MQNRIFNSGVVYINVSDSNAGVILMLATADI